MTKREQQLQRELAAATQRAQRAEADAEALRRGIRRAMRSAGYVTDTGTSAIVSDLAFTLISSPALQSSEPLRPRSRRSPYPVDILARE